MAWSLLIWSVDVEMLASNVMMVFVWIVAQLLAVRVIVIVDKIGRDGVVMYSGDHEDGKVSVVDREDGKVDSRHPVQRTLVRTCSSAGWPSSVRQEHNSTPEMDRN